MSDHKKNHPKDRIMEHFPSILFAAILPSYYRLSYFFDFTEPRDDYPGWRGSSPRIHTPGHTWKPAGHSFVSNYGARRY